MDNNDYIIGRDAGSDKAYFRTDAKMDESTLGDYIAFRKAKLGGQGEAVSEPFWRGFRDGYNAEHGTIHD